ncbi:Ycf51 family protein [[Phormidium] sp. ETS-05]|uniref:Ycf51 family protein n=1 Tax=[Phormidium] sp. ETS-05 TaxID=222819 RepID=UPI0018EF301C|nr:Ycf51 family protein [[Phormidium] sp. ETS-05]
MVTNADFLLAAKWMGIATVACFVFTAIAFIFKWGFRFRFVGITSFMGVLTAGLFGLGVSLYTRTAVPGAVRFHLVYDNGGTQTAIAVPPTITESQLEATLRQAAYDLFSPGRLGKGENQLTIRARTIIHPQPDVSQPLYLGQVKRSLGSRDDDNMQIEIYPDKLAKLPEVQG